jgi:hypothetical protein
MRDEKWSRESYYRQGPVDWVDPVGLLRSDYAEPDEPSS